MPGKLIHRERWASQTQPNLRATRYSGSSSTRAITVDMFCSWLATKFVKEFLSQKKTAHRH